MGDRLTGAASLFLVEKECVEVRFAGSLARLSLFGHFFLVSG